MTKPKTVNPPQSLTLIPVRFLAIAIDSISHYITSTADSWVSHASGVQQEVAISKGASLCDRTEEEVIGITC